MAIRVGILGYGNLGRGVECAVKHNPDMELKAVFTRRNPDSLSILTEGAKVCRAEDVLSMKDQIDVMILCGGSAMDLPGQTPEMPMLFCRAAVIIPSGARASARAIPMQSAESKA